MSDQVRFFLNGTTFIASQCPKSTCCNLDICPWAYAFIKHIPNLGGTAFFTALFSLILAVQLGLGVYYRNYYFSIAILCGLILEVLGYAGRLMQRNNPFNFSAFLLNLIPLTIGPAFMCAAIYVCLGRIVVIYGSGLSKIRPPTYTFIFVSSDIFSLVLQAVGGAITSIASDDNQSLSQAGINIMIAGLSMQVASLVAFIILCADFAHRVLRNRNAWVVENQNIYHARRFKVFLFAMTTATITILVRSSFRVAELSQGFSGKLANDEVTFMILEGTMVSIACIALTVAHPGFALKGQWKQLGFNWRKKNERPAVATVRSGSDSFAEIAAEK